MAARKPKQWVASVKTVSTYPPESLFTKNASTIARTLASKKVSPKGPVSGLRMLTFFINRAGKGLTSDRRKELELPLFPGYVFVHIALRDRLQVLQLPGVAHFVSFHGKPAPLPTVEIEALRNGLVRNTLAEPHPYLRVGRRVRIHSGPMAGMQGVLVRRKDKFRVVLSIHLIQRSVAVEVDEAEIEPIR